jgi:hypothetical protein
VGYTVAAVSHQELSCQEACCSCSRSYAIACANAVLLCIVSTPPPPRLHPPPSHSCLQADRRRQQWRDHCGGVQAPAARAAGAGQEAHGHAGQVDGRHHVSTAHTARSAGRAGPGGGFPVVCVSVFLVMRAWWLSSNLSLCCLTHESVGGTRGCLCSSPSLSYIVKRPTWSHATLLALTPHPAPCRAALCCAVQPREQGLGCTFLWQ